MTKSGNEYKNLCNLLFIKVLMKIEFGTKKIKRLLRKV